MPSTDTIIAQTQKWLSSIIIAHNICPFAKREFVNKTIHYEVVQYDSVEEQFYALILACEQLDTQPDIETTLLIFSRNLEAFDDYLDFLGLANALMHKQGYEGIYQLASFHPDYCFEGSDPDDASNYTNRSPRPMLHILRESSLEKALKNYPEPENIPKRNIALTRKLGLDVMQKLLSDCF